MRQRSLTQRVFSALFGIWFSLLVTEPITVHACPMHDGPLAQAAAEHAAMMGSASTGVANLQIAPPRASAAQRQHSTEHQGGHEPHQCQCLGCCAGTSAVSLPNFPRLLLQATITAPQARRIAAVDALRVEPRFAYALPYANGPPDHAQLVS